MAQFGMKVKAKNAAKWEPYLATDLFPGETIWAIASLIKISPAIEGMAITNRRIFGFTSYGKTGQKVKVEVLGEWIRGVDIVEKFASNKLYILTDGVPVLFGDVVAEEFDFIRFFVDQLQAQHAVPSIATPATPSPAAPVVSLEKARPVETAPPTLLSDEIARLADMHQKGWLDADEFRAAKRAVIARMG